MKTLVHVKKIDINNGIPKKTDRCPIALACKKMGMKNVQVTDEITAQLGHEFHCYSLPRAASRFIGRFDKGRPVKPFKFFLKEAA